MGSLRRRSPLHDRRLRPAGAGTRRQRRTRSATLHPVRHARILRGQKRRIDRQYHGDLHRHQRGHAARLGYLRRRLSLPQRQHGRMADRPHPHPDDAARTAKPPLPVQGSGHDDRQNARFGLRTGAALFQEYFSHPQILAHGQSDAGRDPVSRK